MQPTMVEIKVPGISATTIFLGIWTILLWIMVGVLLLGMIGKPSEISSLWLMWIVMIGLGILLSNHVVWETIGKVRITISEDRIQIKNINSIIKEEVNILLVDHRGISFQKESSFLSLDFWGFTKGDIVLEHKNGKRRFGKDLSHRESLQAIRKIESTIGAYNQLKQPNNP